MKAHKNTIVVIAIVFATSLSASAQMHEHGKMNPAQKMESQKMMSADNSMDHCSMCGGKLGIMGEPVKTDYNGRELQFCSSGCKMMFEKDPEANLAKIDSEIVAQQKEIYPLETCVVTDEKLGMMGEPVDYVYKNQLVRFCCSGCVETFKKNPDQYLKKLNESCSVKSDAVPEGSEKMHH